MTIRILTGAALILASTVGSAAAQTARAPGGDRAPAVTGSLRAPGSGANAFEAAAPAPSLFGLQRPARSTFNANTARARHYER